MKVRKKAGYCILGIMLILLTVTSLSDSSCKGFSMDNKAKSVLAGHNDGIGTSSAGKAEEDYEIHLLSIVNNNRTGACPNNQCDCSQCSCSQCSGLAGDMTDWNFTAIGADFLQNQGLYGKGIKVALFDTGIDLNNSDLNIAGGVSFIDGVESYADDNGHGTAMAGILAAQKNGSGLLGIAPEVDLYSVKVLDKNGIGKYSNIIQGIEWAIDNDIDIITLSLGGTQYSKILSDEIDKAVKNNILIIAAAGNEGKEETMYPAAYQQVINVGASDIDQQIAEFSDYGNMVDILAPGTDIRTIGTDNSMTTISGTSASVQQVAGVAALLWSSDKKLTNENIRGLLLNNSLYLNDKNKHKYRELSAAVSYENLLKGKYTDMQSDKTVKSSINKDAEESGEDSNGMVLAQATCKHSSTTSSTTSATCTSAGKVVISCAKCGKVLTTTTLPALGHSMTSTKYSETCTSAGLTVKTCTKCGYTTSTPFGTPLGHYSVLTESYPTCTTDGYRCYKCNRCNTILDYEILPALGHDGDDRIGEHVPGYGHYHYCECRRCGKILTSCYVHNTYTTAAGPHTSSGHLVQTICTYCFKVESSSYTTVSTCLSCTTAPSVSLTNLTGNTVLSETDTNFLPQIKVSDEESDSITCNYYLDGSTNSAGTIIVASTRTGTVASFTTPINAANLSEGTHTIQVTAKDPIAAALGQVSITFLVDKSEPTIGSVTPTATSTDITLEVTASDDRSGLSDTAYRYTLTGFPSTDWMSSSSCPFTGLTPNTPYSYQVEVRDKVGNVVTYSGTAGTSAELPVIALTALSENKVQVQRTDTNPADTLYKVSVSRGSNLIGYLDATGAIIPSQSWISLSSLTVSGLDANTAYTFSITAKTTDSGMTDTASEYITTSPAIPAQLKASVVDSSLIRLSWNNSGGANSYEIMRERLDSNNAVLQSDTICPETSQSYEDNAVSENQTYHYKIRSKDLRGLYSAWSEPVEVSTLPAPPVKITEITSDINGSVINLSWTAVEGAVGYLVKFSYDGIEKEIYSTENGVSFDTDRSNCQCSYTVKAFNVCSTGDPLNSALWSNAGEASDEVIIQTYADTPTFNPVSQGAITANSVEISWQTKRNPDSVSYVLGVYKDGEPQEEITTVNNHYEVTGLDSESTYTFKVKARNSYQIDTPWSEEVSATTLIDYPGVPAELKATSIAGYILLSWKASEHAQSYQVERDGEIIATDLKDTTYQDSNIDHNTSYSYRIKAVNTTGESSWCQPLTKKSLGELPATPAITSVTGSSISLRVEWSTVDGTAGYDIEADGMIYNMGLETTYEHNGLLPGSEHRYRVRTRNTFGKSEWSEPYTIRTEQIIPIVPTITTVDVTDTMMQISWTAVSGAACYALRIDDTDIGNILTSEYQYTVAGDQVAGSTHSIQVRAVNEAGASEWSSTYSATLLPEGSGSIIPKPVPSVPVPVISTAGVSIIALSWNAVDNASYYQLEADGSIIYTGTDTEYIHTGLSADSEHRYRVCAGNLSGISEWSVPVTGRTGAGEATAPTNISYIRKSDTATTITWDMVPGAAGYRIEINGSVRDDVITDTRTDMSTTVGTVYNIRIASVRSDGSASSLEWSDEVTFCTPREIPKAVTLSSLWVGKDFVKISWNKEANATGYQVKIDDNIIGPITNITFRISWFNPGVTHTLRVRAYNEAGYGDWSITKTVIMDSTIPGVPTNVSGGPAAASNASTGAAIKIWWDGVSGANSYEIEDMNGTIYTTTACNKSIENLIPVTNYTFRVRAVIGTEKGAWSSRIAITPILTTPTGVSASAISANSVVRISWNRVGAAQKYEVMIDGIVVAATKETGLDFDYNMFFARREIRIRACYEDQYSDWSVKTVYDQPQSVSTEVTAGEEFSVLLPVSNVDVKKYQLTLSYNSEELELVDACELTPQAEQSTVYIEDLNTYVFITEEGSVTKLTFIVNQGEEANWSGLASGITLRSKITGKVTLQYGVTLR